VNSPCCLFERWGDGIGRGRTFAGTLARLQPGIQREWLRMGTNGHESFGDVVFFRCMVGTLARSATGSCDERVSGSGSGDASEVCVEGTFVGTFARSATGSCDERVSGSGSGDASEVCVEGTFGRNVCTFRYGELR